MELHNNYVRTKVRCSEKEQDRIKHLVQTIKESITINAINAGFAVDNTTSAIIEFFKDGSIQVTIIKVTQYNTFRTSITIQRDKLMQKVTPVDIIYQEVKTAIEKLRNIILN